MKSTRPLDSSPKGRSRLITLLILGAVGLGYYALMRLTGLSLFCPFQKLTGLACPGCGVTHLCTRLIEGNFAAAPGENWGITAAGILWLGAAGVTLLKRRQIRGLTHTKGMQAVTWCCVGLLLLFGAARNLPGLEFLLPSYMR